MIIVLVIISVLGFTTAQSAFAQVVDRTGVPRGIGSSDGDYLRDPDTRLDPLEYWTPQRMEEAIAATEGDRPTATSRESNDRPTRAPSVVTAPPSVGRLFFTNTNGEDRVCTASVVDSATENIIITAAHCVYTRLTGWNSNIVFVPAYNNGQRPYGSWRSLGKVASTGFTQQNNNKYDQAFVKVENVNGATIQDTVGSNSMAYDAGFIHTGVTFLGYPSQYNGVSNGIARYCIANTVRRYATSDDAQLGCALGGGASGGPWYTTVNATTGTIFAVNSRGSADGEDVQYAAPLHQGVQSLLAQIEGSFL